MLYNTPTLYDLFPSLRGFILESIRQEALYRSIAEDVHKKNLDKYVSAVYSALLKGDHSEVEWNIGGDSVVVDLTVLEETRNEVMDQISTESTSFHLMFSLVLGSLVVTVIAVRKTPSLEFLLKADHLKWDVPLDKPVTVDHDIVDYRRLLSDSTDWYLLPFVGEEATSLINRSVQMYDVADADFHFSTLFNPYLARDDFPLKAWGDLVVGPGLWIVLGPPGSGKSVMASSINDTYLFRYSEPRRDADDDMLTRTAVASILGHFGAWAAVTRHGQLTVMSIDSFSELLNDSTRDGAAPGGIPTRWIGAIAKLSNTLASLGLLTLVTINPDSLPNDKRYAVLEALIHGKVAGAILDLVPNKEQGVISCKAHSRYTADDNRLYNEYDFVVASGNFKKSGDSVKLGCDLDSESTSPSTCGLVWTRA